MTETTKQSRPRRVRSFVRRAGRLTPSQQKALASLWPKYGVAYTGLPADLSGLFDRDRKVTLEIGFGNGDTLVDAAIAAPDRNFIGIEVHEPGIGHCLIRIRDDGVDNVRLINHDAIEVLANQLAPGSLDRINLYFPDPWPKKRHHKRRIVQPSFLELTARTLQPGGSLHIATDWREYAEHIDATLADSLLFECAERREHDGDKPLERPVTKFERRGMRRGHRIWDWRFKKTASFDRT